MVIHPLQSGVKVFCPVGPDLGNEELRPDEVAQHLLQGQAVLFIDAEQEEGQHQADHQQRRRFISETAPREDIGGYADQPARAEANELALGQVEGHLVFYLGKVFRDRNKGQCNRKWSNRGNCSFFKTVRHNLKYKFDVFCL